MTNQFKQIFILGFLVFFCFFGIGNNILAEENNLSDIANPVLLPNSPLYFLKDIGRNIQSFFVFNPEKKAELRLDFANQKIVEIQKLNQLQTNNEKSLNKALQGYEKETEKLKQAIEILKKDNPNNEKLLNDIIEQSFNHQQILGEIKSADPSILEKAQKTGLKNFTDSFFELAASEKIQKIIETNLNKNFPSLSEKIEKLDLVNQMDKAVSDDLKKQVVKIQENITKQVSQSYLLSEAQKLKLSQSLEEIKAKPEYKQIALEDLANQIISQNPESIKNFESIPELDKEKIKSFAEDILKQKNIDFNQTIEKFNSLEFSEQTKKAINQIASDFIAEQLEPKNQTNPQIIGLPNPASVFCEDQGYKLEIRTSEDGSQFGVCIFPNNQECEEWKFFRKECGQEYLK